MSEISAFGVIHKAAPKPVDPPEDYIPGSRHKVYGRMPRVKGPEHTALTRAGNKYREHRNKKTRGTISGAATTGVLGIGALGVKNKKAKAAFGIGAGITGAATLGHNLHQGRKEKQWKKKRDKADTAYEKVLTAKYPHVL